MTFLLGIYDLVAEDLLIFWLRLPSFQDVTCTI